MMQISLTMQNSHRRSEGSYRRLLRWPTSVTAKTRLTAKHNQLTAKHNQLKTEHNQLTTEHNQLNFHGGSPRQTQGRTD